MNVNTHRLTQSLLIQNLPEITEICQKPKICPHPCTHAPTRESGAGKKGRALPKASWQLPALTAASDGNCMCSEPSCKPSPHWERGTHSSLWREQGCQERSGTANSSCQHWQLPVMAGAVSPHVSSVPIPPVSRSGCWT